MKIVSYSDDTELDTLGDAWDRLNEQELRSVPSFAELRLRLQAGAKFRILVALDNAQIVNIAIFIYRDRFKRFEVATRKLFELPVEEVSLFGANVAGRPDEDITRQFFQVIIDAGGFDVIDVGDILVDSALYKVVTSLRRDFVAWHIMREQQIRWMIELPRSFDDYFSSLRATAKPRISRGLRRFEKAAPEFRVTQRPEDVETFLRDAEVVSRLTYQWTLGYKTADTAAMRSRLTHLAKNGNLRAYIAYIEGKPCVFAWGDLSHRTFGFRATGYDPHYRAMSPGTALIMHIVRDLIENTDCEVFDFLAGGETGYKSRLSTVGLACARMQVAQISRPYPLLIVLIDKTINCAKNAILKLTDFILGDGEMRQRLKRALRPFGVGTY
jgi:hypothetical protein